MLKETWEKLHFDVTVYQNLVAHEVNTVMSGIGKKDHSDYNAFVCCVLTHGAERIVFGVDGR